MSDGNFNRSLIPQNSYASGVRAGRAQMNKSAIIAFEQWYDEQFPAITASERHLALMRFRELLRY